MAPVAYFAGALKAVGASAPTILSPSANPSAFVDMTDAVWSCDQFGDKTGMRNNLRERACGPRPIEAARRRCTPLRSALLQSIAGDAEAPAERLEVPEPLLASASMTSSDPLGETAGPGGGELSFMGEPTLNGSGGLPYILAFGPVAQSGSGDQPTPTTPFSPGGPGGGGPDGMPPDVTQVPLPGAAPFLLTGALALYGARRRKAKSA